MTLRDIMVSKISHDISPYITIMIHIVSIAQLCYQSANKKQHCVLTSSLAVLCKLTLANRADISKAVPTASTSNGQIQQMRQNVGLSRTNQQQQ